MFKKHTSVDLIILLVKENTGATLAIAAALLIAGLLEAVGISAIFPLISMMLDMTSELPPSKLTDFIYYISQWGPYKLSLFIISAFVLKAGMMHLSYSLIAKNVSAFSHKLRTDFIKAILNARVHYTQSKSLGKNLSVLTADSVNAAAAYISAARVLSDIFQVLIYLAYAFWLSATATLISMITMGFLAIIVKNTMGKTRKAGKKTTNHIHEISKNMGETLRGIKAAKAMAQEDYLQEKIVADSAELCKAHRVSLVIGQVLRNIQDPVLITSALIILILFKDFLALEAGYIMFILAVYYRLMTSMNMLQGDYQKFIGQEAALWSIKENIDFARTQAEPKQDGGKIPNNTPHDIHFKKVSVTFDDGLKIFNNVTFMVPARSFCVFKGESGRGKTTASDMICGLVKPTSGQLLIGETPLEEINTQRWRTHIGYVDQFPFLFKGTIRDNILLNRDGIDDGEILECLKLCSLEKFITRLDGGLDHVLSEGAVNISGGERQRIAIARAIIGKPAYLILDEPTSALDQESQSVIFETLKTLSKIMSVIVISHSPEIINHADHVIDFDSKMFDR